MTIPRLTGFAYWTGTPIKWEETNAGTDPEIHDAGSTARGHRSCGVGAGFHAPRHGHFQPPDEDDGGLGVLKNWVKAASTSAIAVALLICTQLCGNGGECLQGAGRNPAPFWVPMAGSSAPCARPYGAIACLFKRCGSVDAPSGSQCLGQRVIGSLRRPFQRVKIHMDQAEAFLIPQRPFIIIHQ